MGSRLKVPVLFVYVMKESKKHYHLYARKAVITKHDAQGLLESYTQSVTWILEKYPLQWFNYYPFWEDELKDGPLNINKGQIDET